MGSEAPTRWTAKRANAWYDAQPWLVGANFSPSTASNQLEMWQAETFDRQTIARELGWARDLGMNTMRVFLHDLLWETEGFIQRVDAFLEIAATCGIRPMFVLFDDCWHDGAALGPQPPPVPGVHNSRWLQSPGQAVIDRPNEWGRLEAYVRGVIERFGSDDRVLAWDLYNEPTNMFLVDQALPPRERAAAAEAASQRRIDRMDAHLRLLDLSFAWARAAHPGQPLTAAPWLPDRALNARMTAASDVITFHTYEDVATLEARIASLRQHERPLICTEWMARTRGSRFETHLPVFQRERVGCYMWGFVNGKTQTHIAWSPSADEAWFHDLLYADGTPYDPAETALIQSFTSSGGEA